MFRRWEPIKPLSVTCLLILAPLVLSVLFLRLASVLGAILLSFAIYLSTLLTSIVLYRISPFHPLAKYPGPIIARTTALWMAYIASKRKRQYYVQQLHHQYGDIVRLGNAESRRICVHEALLTPRHRSKRVVDTRPIGDYPTDGLNRHTQRTWNDRTHHAPVGAATHSLDRPH